MLDSTIATSEGHKEARWVRPVLGFRQVRSRAVMALMVCVMLVPGAGAAWLLAERTRLIGQVEQLQNEQGKTTKSEEELKQQINQQRALNDELVHQLNQTTSKLGEKEQEIAKLKQANGSNQMAVNASIVAMILSPELGRGEDEPNQVYLSKGIDRLQLKLEVEEEKYKRYRAEVRTAEGEEILRSDNLKASRGEKIEEAELAAKRFAKGDYIIVLSGANGDRDYEKISTYHFRVIR